MLSLNPLQEQVLLFISGEAKNRLETAAGYAFALHRDLTTAGVPLQFSEHISTNRKCKPDDPEFFNHVQALQDFVQLVNAHRASEQ